MTFQIENYMEQSKKYYLADLSFIDYSEKISDLLYVKKCNFNCAYCYNKKTLNSLSTQSFLTVEEVIDKISKGKLSNALTITGGEPSTIEVEEIKKLISSVKRYRGEEYKIKIDTNGSNLLWLKEIIKEIDTIAIDIKGDKETYNEISGNESSYEELKKTIKFLYEQEDNKNLKVIYRFIYYPMYFKKIESSVSFLSKYFNKEKMSYSFNEYKDYGLLEKIEITKKELDEALDFLKSNLGG